MLNRRLTTYLVAVIAFAVPFSLLFFQKDVTATQALGGLTREQAIQRATGMVPSSPDGLSNIVAVRTTLGRVERALGDQSATVSEREVWLVSMKGSFIWPSPPPGTPSIYDNAFVILDAKTGSRMIRGSQTKGQLILPAN